jgi:hypothetical protein
VFVCPFVGSNINTRAFSCFCHRCDCPVSGSWCSDCRKKQIAIGVEWGGGGYDFVISCCVQITNLLDGSYVTLCLSTTLDLLILRFYYGVFKSFRIGRLEQELQMVKLSATSCSCIAILWVSLVSFAAITLCGGSQGVFIVVSIYFFYGLRPETFGYTLVSLHKENGRSKAKQSRAEQSKAKQSIPSQVVHAIFCGFNIDIIPSRNDLNTFEVRMYKQGTWVQILPLAII